MLNVISDQINYDRFTRWLYYKQYTFNHFAINIKNTHHIRLKILSANCHLIIGLFYGKFLTNENRLKIHFASGNIYSILLTYYSENLTKGESYVCLQTKLLVKPQFNLTTGVYSVVAKNYCYAHLFVDSCLFYLKVQKREGR